MKIFLVAGKAGSGKNEVAKLIKEYYIYKHEKAVITHFSKYLKNFAVELTDWDGNPNTKPRVFLQELGAKIRKLDKDFLINYMLDDLVLYEEYVDNVIISDVRLPLEIERIKEEKENVYSIYVVNQFELSPLTIEEQADITETALETYTEFDVIIANDKLDLLKEKVFKLLGDIDNEKLNKS